CDRRPLPANGETGWHYRVGILSAESLARQRCIILRRCSTRFGLVCSVASAESIRPHISGLPWHHKVFDTRPPYGAVFPYRNLVGNCEPAPPRQNIARPDDAHTDEHYATLHCSAAAIELSLPSS